MHDERRYSTTQAARKCGSNEAQARRFARERRLPVLGRSYVWRHEDVVAFAAERVSAAEEAMELAALEDEIRELEDAGEGDH